MYIDLTKTSGTSPPALYHHTHSLSLPQIMRDGFLKPLNSEAVRTGDTASDAAPEYVHATTNPEGDSTSTLAYVLRNRPDLDHIRIRFTLHAEDFKPWRETVEAEPRYPQKLIDALILSAQRLGVSPYSWFVSESEVPLQRVKAIHFKTKRDGDWREIQHPWRFVLETDDAIGFGIGLRETPETNFVEWSQSRVDENGRVAKIAMYRTLARDTYDKLFANGWKSEAEPPQDCPEPYKYRTYDLRKASLPLNTVQFMDAAFPLTRYSGEIDEPEVASPPLAVLNTPKEYSDFSKTLDAMATEFTASPKGAKPAPLPATPNAKRMTTDIRHVVTEDTFERYPPEDIEAEKAELIAEGMWNLPHGDEAYTIRMDAIELAKGMNRAGLMNDARLKQWLSAYLPNFKEFIDFDIQGDNLLRVSRVFRLQMSGNIDKRAIIERPSSETIKIVADMCKDIGTDPTTRQSWWEKGNWLFHRTDVIDTEEIAAAAVILRDILTLAFLDTSITWEKTVRETLSQKQERTSPFRRNGPLYNPEQDVHEVTIRLPGYHLPNGERSDPTGRKLRRHRRRGHVRVYHRGLPNEFKKYIQPMHINCGGSAPPPVVYKLRAS